MTTHPTANPALDDGGALRGGVVLALLALLGSGAGYSALGAGIGGVLFPLQAGGSLVARDGRVVGSSLVAQPFADARYFRPRPSATGHDPMATAGSNQARGNPELRARIDAAIAEVAVREGVAPEAVPADVVTQSGGGLDPHLSPESAKIQVARI
ncbi:MAG TPA: potassium-transporting ATPase subunit C, partial [Luteimonas sp.]|nr:potassium-transporting ATPase subunit C [Luteimonas sp.]